jgi:hypothetical protein
MTRSASPSRPANRLLASLPRADLARVMPSLEQVDLPLGQHLHDPGSAQEHFYFRGTSIVSLVGVLRNGDATELSLVGCEGGVGVGLILGRRDDAYPSDGAERRHGAALEGGGPEARAQARRHRPAGCSFATCRLCGPRQRNPRCATGITRSSSRFAGGCCLASIESITMSCA